MDTNTVSTTTPIGGFTAVSPNVGEAAKTAISKDVVGAEPSKSEVYKNGVDCNCGRALEIFRQEVKTAMSAEFGVSASSQRSGFDTVKDAASPDDVAAETLGTASRIAAEYADVSSYALLKFRQRVQAAAVTTQQTVGGDDDIGKVDDAVGKVQSGLDALDSDAARNVESSASVLSVNSQQRQRSTIRIRTQEGDVVRLDVKRSNRLSAQDVAAANENGSASRTEVAVSSRSRLTLSVNGDLNDAELAAIQNVFAQAESIADEFFDGDLSQAFSLAAGLEFDAEQLSRVNLRFRSREVTTATFAQIQNGLAPPAVTAQPEPAAVDGSVKTGQASTGPVAPPIAAASPEPGATVKDEAAPTEPKSADTPAPVPQPAQTVDLSDASFHQFFDLLAGFLNSVADGFERAADRFSLPGAERETSAFKYHYSQSFKLEIFKSVLELTASANEADAAGELAVSLIDGIADTTQANGDKD